MNSRRKLGSHLEWHGGSIRVTLSIPRQVRDHFGGRTRLKQSLGTDSPVRAEALKWKVVASLKAQLDAAARRTETPLIAEALRWKAEVAAAARATASDEPTEPWSETLSLLLSERAEEIEASQGHPAARQFYDIASGQATPIDHHLETFLAEREVTPRYKDDIRRAVKRLSASCAKAAVAGAIEGVTRKAAGAFISNELTVILGDRKTINKDISALRTYWTWLGKRGHFGDVPANPWDGQSFEVQRSAGLAKEGSERAFTQVEAATLLHGPASPRMRDVMWIAALSGMRIDEVCRLQVRDCGDGWFAVNARRATTGEGKTEAARRDVPIHPALNETVERLTKGKALSALLIDGLPDADPSGKRKPSAAAGQEFTRYRRAMGVDEVVEGKRRARVNFHSWRRWFVTEALRSGHLLHIVSALVGHEDGQKGVTLGSYFRDGPSAEQFRAVIASIKVPLPNGARDDERRVA